MRKPGSQLEWEERRMIAANMFEQNVATQIVKKTLNVDDQTVRRWRRMFNAKGREGLKAHKHVGRTARMDDQQKQRLREARWRCTRRRAG